MNAAPRGGSRPQHAGDDGVAWLALTVLLCLGALVVATEAPGGTGSPAGGATAALDWEPGLGLHEPWRLWTAAWVHWSGAHLVVNLVGAVVVGAVGWRARAPRAAALAWLAAWPLTHLLMAVPDSARLAQSLQHYGGLSGVLHAGVVVLGLTLAWTHTAFDLGGVPGSRGVRSGLGANASVGASAGAGSDARSDAAGPPGAGQAPSEDSAFAPTGSSAIEHSRITEGPWAMTTLEELSVARGRPSAIRTTSALAPLTAGQARRHRWVGAAILAGTVLKVLSETPWDLSLRPNAMLGIDVAPLAHACGIAAGVLAWMVAVACVRGLARPARP